MKNSEEENQESAEDSHPHHPHHHHDHTPSHSYNYAIAGAISGLFTRAMCQPLDVVKIRFQLQTEPISKRNVQSKYTGNVQALRLILKEEGVQGLWRGHTAAQLLSITYGLVQFQVYELAKSQVQNSSLLSNFNVDKNSAVHFFCGGTAGCAATIASFPFDIIRTRLVAQGNNKHYTGIVHGLKLMYKNEGVFACWRGLSPALIVAGPFIGFQFAFYEFFKNVIIYFKFFGVRKDYTCETNALGKLVAGSLSGLCSKAITYPFDLARKRMQIQNFQHARVGFGSGFWCTNLITCLVTTFKNERIRGIYKGLTPTLVKAGANTALHFMYYEEVLRLLNSYT